MTSLMIPRDTTSPLWAITCYFNPAGYQARLRNYRSFRQLLEIPLVTVEVSFEGTFRLGDDDAELLIPLCNADVMWQKERLLNLALHALPSHVAKVAWLDCDVVFDRPDWFERAEQRLDDVPLVHLFDEAFDLSPDDSQQITMRSPLTPSRRGRSAVAAWLEGDASPAGVFAGSMSQERLQSGLAWAARREILVQSGFYDACILGGGDRAMICASLGLCDAALFERQHMNARQIDFYRSWAQRHAPLIDGNVTAIEGRVYHLWHGHLTDRQYAERHIGFAQFEFDPQVDVTLSADGCWMWHSEKPTMHEYVRRYFTSRNEDG